MPCATLIRAAGADLEVDPGLLRYLHKRARRLRIERTPFRHTVLVKADMAHGPAGAIVGKARTLHLVDPDTWGSPVIKAGAEVAFAPDGAGSYRYRVGGRDFALVGRRAQPPLRRRHRTGSRTIGRRSIPDAWRPSPSGRPNCAAVGRPWAWTGSCPGTTSSMTCWNCR